MSTLLLVRHGRTTANAAGTLAGWTPGVHLDDSGRQQASAVGARIAAAELRISRIVTSPLERCLETADLLRRAAGPTWLPGEPEVDDRWGECRYGAWTGQPLSELAKDPLWRVVQDQPSAARFPDGEGFPGESLAQMQARAVAAVREMDAEITATDGPSAVWLVVSHGDVIKSVLADAAGSHLDHFQRLRVDPASVSAVQYTDRRPFVLRSNDVGGDLSGVRPPEVPAAEAVPGGGAGHAPHPGAKG